MPRQKRFCLYCKLETDTKECPNCGKETHGYRHIMHVSPMHRHASPGDPLINIKQVVAIRDGPMLAQCAVLRKYFNKGYRPEDTLIVFYPYGLNSVSFPIYETFIKLGYTVVLKYYDSGSDSGSGRREPGYF